MYPLTLHDKRERKIYEPLKSDSITQIILLPQGGGQVWIFIKIMKEKVLQAMREAGKPVSAGDVTKALGADRKEVDKAFAELKKEGAIISPVRCKWAPAE